MKGKKGSHIAKGDQATAQQATTQLGNAANQSTGNLQNKIGGQADTMTSQFQAPYLNSVNQQGNNYNEIMGNYRNFLSRGSFGSNGAYSNNTSPGGYGGNLPVTYPVPGSSNQGLYPGGPIHTEGSPVDPGLGNQLQGNGLNNGQGGNDFGLTFSNNNGQISANGPSINTGSTNTGLVPGAEIGTQQVNNGMGNIYSSGSPAQGSPLSSGGPVNGDYQGTYNQIMGGANNQASLLAHKDQLAAAGIQLSPANAQGKISKIGIPDGNGGTQWVRVIGEGEGHPVWIPQDSSSGGQMSDGGSFGPSIQDALAGYKNFALTGGFSPQDIQNMQARSAAPIRGIYNQAQQDLQRSKSLNNGVSPNYAAASAQMNRDMSNNIANQLQASDANIAQMRQQGQLSGLGGLSQTGLLGRGQDISNYQTLRGQDLQNSQVGRGQDLSAIQGMSGLYGTAPGAAGLFGNQYIQSGLGGQSNQIQMQQLLNALNLGLIGANQTNATIPSTAQNVMQNINWGADLAGKVIGGFA